MVGDDRERGEVAAERGLEEAGGAVEGEHGVAVGFGGEEGFGTGAGGGAAGGAEGGVLQEREEAFDEGGDVAGGGEGVGGEGPEHVGDAVDVGGDDGTGVGEGFHDDAGVRVAAGRDEEDVDGRIDGGGVGEGAGEGDEVSKTVLADEIKRFAMEVFIGPRADDEEFYGDGALFELQGDLEGNVNTLAAGKGGDERDDGNGVLRGQRKRGQGEGI